MPGQDSLNDDEQKLQCVRKTVLSGREDIQDINFKER